MTTNRNQNKAQLASLCHSFADRAELETIEPIGDVALAILRDSGGDMSRAKAQLIESVRAGKHVELRARIIGFRQKDGHPNKNFLRFKSSKLADIAASFARKPFLLNHNKWDQEARQGTIESSEAAALAGGWTGFRMGLHVVKPHGVISILDGTLDMFSIGWDPRGAVICTAHGVDVRSRKSCYWTEGCYPGKLVEIDGASKIAEYEWQTTEGLEVSGVNTPAVSGTKIEEIRTALAAELEIADHEPSRKDPPMRFPLLLAALSVNVAGDLSETDDATLARAAKELADGKLAAEQERDAALERAKTAEKSLADERAKTAKLEATQLDALLESKGYKAGKLIRGKDKDGKSTPSPREPRLRRIFNEDGLSAVEAELAEMPAITGAGRDPILADEDPNPRSVTRGEIPSSVLASTAKQLGLKPEDLEAHHNQLAGRDSGENN